MTHETTPFFTSKRYVSSTKSSSSQQPPDYSAHHPDYVFTVKMIGDRGCGKKSLLNRLVNDDFKDYVSPNDFCTDGSSNKRKTMEVDDKTVQLNIWYDVSNHDYATNSKTITSGHKKRAQYAGIYLLTFDLTDMLSFNNAKDWLKEIEKDYENRVSETKPVIVLVGTKADEIDKRVVDREQHIKPFFEENKSLIDGCYETSAKDGEMIDELFSFAASKAINNRKIENKEELQESVPSCQEKKVTKQQLMDRLRNYINRVESHQLFGEPNYKHGFWFFAESRGANRKANYLLAKELLARLEGTRQTNMENIGKIFQGSDALRDNVITQNRDKFSQQDLNCLNRGMNSAELKGIIQDALAGQQSSSGLSSGF